MTWKGKDPWVTLTEKPYEIGNKVEKEVMKSYENDIERANDLEKWFVTLKP